MSGLRRCGLVILFLGIVAYQSIPTEGISFSEYTTLSKNQKLTFDKFKSRVEPKLEEEFMKNDIYLIRWLRNARFDVNRAEAALFAYVRRRNDKGFAKLLDEDFTDFRKDYPFWIEGEDREGRPLLIAPLQDWDIRRAALTGNLPRLNRMYEKMLEEAMRKVRDLQDQGKNVTQFSMVAAVGNLNTAEHFNPATVPFWLASATAYELQSSGLTDKIILLDSNKTFDLVLTLVGPILTPQTRKALTQIQKSDHDRVFDFIDPKFLPISYGGTKIFT